MGPLRSLKRIAMASQRSSRALRVALRQASAPRVQQRTFVSAVNAASRPSVQPAQKAIASSFVQQTRGAKTVDFAGDKEKVYERNDWPHDKLLDYFKNDTLALIGYGSQGHGQGLNLRDNGLNVIVGVRKDGASWKEAIQDGWVPGKNLFEVDEAIQKGSIIMNLLSDAAQSETWPRIKPMLTKGKTLYFSHGFSPVFKDQTRVDVPNDIDVILVAPKGSGRTVRTLFREGRGINSSFAVFQDVTGKAEERAVAMGVAVGSGYFYETVEEATQSLYPLIGQNGMDYMYAACSTTARRGAIDWSKRFKDSLKPVFEDLYESVRSGKETQRTMEYASRPDYRQAFEKEMEEIRNMEIWRAGKAVRSLRPENN